MVVLLLKGLGFVMWSIFLDPESNIVVVMDVDGSRVVLLD